MTKDEAITLKALKYAASLGHGSILREMKITPFTIKREEAFAQPEQEPVDCKVCGGTGEVETGIGMMVCDECHGAAYTTPPKRPWVGLTEDEIIAVDMHTLRVRGDGYTYARAVEAKLKELNT